MKKTTLLIILLLSIIIKLKAQTTVSSLTEFQTIVKSSNLNITLAPGNYNLETDLPSGSRVIDFSGSNNTITLTGVYIKVPVGCIKESYLTITGNNNTIKDGEIEDTYKSGITEVTDFSSYNQDRANLAYGLGGQAVMRITGNENLVDGIKMTVRGSYPYGYGSIYGIGSDNVFGLDKRCGIVIKGIKNTLDNVELLQRAFGHGIYMQDNADQTLIKNSSVKGRVRATGELYQETNIYDLPFRSNYKLPLVDDGTTTPLPIDEYHSLCEDAYRMYGIPGSVTIENCTADKMRGGFRLYLGGPATVKNSTATDCGSSNYNLPANSGIITNSSGNFAYAPLSDFALGRNGYNAEWTIIPSPHATGPHNIIDIKGNNHNLIFHREDGPIDTTDRAIVVTGNNSTITNETEYKIVLESSTSGNTIHNCGGAIITDNGTNNTILTYENCEDIGSDSSCSSSADLIEAECFDLMTGIQVGDSSEGGSNIGYINPGDWVKFSNIDLTGKKSINARTASIYNGGYIEVYLNQINGTLIGTIPVTNSGGWQNWQTNSVDLSSFTDGVYDIYFVFKGTRTGYLFNVNWFSFSNETLSINPYEKESNVKIFPIPSENIIYIHSSLANNFELSVFDLSGKMILSERGNQIDISSLAKGAYILKGKTLNYSFMEYIVKK
ncbi:carbohydrate-binding protein [Seonamhaeicola sp. MEBiC1930]|uniref:carbohydrate-binding protein n=1 Tax=Seonamhaeicola sp. MEBiC01930 TaxID=2976768 RepID=UPI003247301C